MTFRIMYVDSKQRWIAACGFRSLDRVNKWIEQFDPRMYTDKTLKKENLVIEEEK